MPAQLHDVFNRLLPSFDLRSDSGGPEVSVSEWVLGMELGR